MAQNLLEVKDLVVQYIVDEDVVEAVNGVSFSLGNQETIGLVGETGAGKTTTALSIMGLIAQPPGKIVSGEIYYNGQDLLKISEKEYRDIRGDEITMIFQDPMTSLNPVLTVGEQISEVIRLHEKISRADAEKKACDMLEMVGITANRYDQYPHEFSGGMKQRIMIAIALACSPKLLIADEPTTALDVTIQAQVLELMNKLKKDIGTSMILITHDLGVVAEVCDKVAIIYAGEVVEAGTLEQVYNNIKHPYTQGLFDSLPDLDVETDRLKTINGMMPDPSNLPKGCKFHPRCQHCMERCAKEAPPTIDFGEGHIVKCWLSAQEVQA